jgi:hypothetical protein
MWDARVEGLAELEKDLEAAQKALVSGAQHAVGMACREGAAEARANHRYKDRTHKLTESIRGEDLYWTREGAEGVIVAAKHYASFVEEGTPPHDIYPKLGGGFIGPGRKGQGRRKIARAVLAWSAGGTMHFARFVHHPGTPSLPFMALAYIKAERVLEREMHIALAQAQAIFDR